MTQDQLNLIRDKGIRAILSFTYEHGRSRFHVKVGQPRVEHRRETGPRGGYRNNADFERIGRETGKKVSMILNTGGLIEVYSFPGDGWAYPSLVGSNEIRGEVEYFEEFA